MKTARKSWAFGAAACLVAWTSSPGIAAAGPREAEVCAARLTIPGQKMFHAIAGQVKGDSDIASLMTRIVRPMVMAGRISRAEAEQNAPSVARCLLLQKRD
jgi:hypothetical protein